MLLKSLSSQVAHMNTPLKCPHYLFYVQTATKYDIYSISSVSEDEEAPRLIFDVGRLFDGVPIYNILTTSASTPST